MISLCGGLVLCISDVISQVVMVVAIPLDFLVQLRGCFILYKANNVWPCDLKGFFNLPWWYFYCWRLRRFYNIVKLSRSPSDCQDPIQSKIDPLLLLWLHSNHPLRLRHYTNQNPEFRAPPKTFNALLSLSENSKPSENPNHIPVFICLHHSVLVLLNSKLIFMFLSQFSPFCFQYIKPFQYSRSLILASTLPSYISASFLLNSSNSL